jgi:hypothetical protein
MNNFEAWIAWTVGWQSPQPDIHEGHMTWTFIVAVCIAGFMPLYMGANIWSDWYLNQHKYKYGLLVLIACAIEAVEDWRRSIVKVNHDPP